MQEDQLTVTDNISLDGNHNAIPDICEQDSIFDEKEALNIVSITFNNSIKDINIDSNIVPGWIDIPKRGIAHPIQQDAVDPSPIAHIDIGDVWLVSAAEHKLPEGLVFQLHRVIVVSKGAARESDILKRVIALAFGAGLNIEIIPRIIDQCCIRERIIGAVHIIDAILVEISGNVCQYVRVWVNVDAIRRVWVRYNGGKGVVIGIGVACDVYCVGIRAWACRDVAKSVE